MATLYEIWRLALPSATFVRAGYADHRSVRTTLIARQTQPALPELLGNELILFNLAVLDFLRLSLVQLVERLAETRILAIGLAGTIDQRAIQAAQRYNLTLFELPSDSDIRQVQREIDRLASDPEAQYERRAAQLYSELTQHGLTAGREMVLQTLRQWTGHEVWYPAEPDAPSAVPVLVHGRRSGFLASQGDQAWDRLALAQGAAALALLLDKEQAISALEDKMRGSVLEALLAGITLDVQAQQRAIEQGIMLDADYVLAAVRSQPAINHERIIAAVRRVCERLNLQAVIDLHDDLVVLALPVSDPTHPEQMLRTVHSTLANDQWVLDAGYGLTAESQGWAGAWAEALGALRLGRELFGAGVLAGGIELGVYRLLLGIADSARARVFYDHTIGVLASHDARNTGDLVDTLQTFFSYLGNHSQAASALHIHRNTLLYRLSRIEQICNRHLERAPDRLALQIGLALHQIYRGQP